MTDDRYEALYACLDRLLTDVEAGSHATAMAGMLRLQAVLLTEMHVLQQRIEVLTQGLSGVAMEHLKLHRRVALLETPLGGRPGREA